MAVLLNTGYAQHSYDSVMIDVNRFKIPINVAGTLGEQSSDPC